MPKTPEGLRPANENPWYILMTLHGDDGSFANSDKNRMSWNTWAGQGLSDEARANLMNGAGVPLADFSVSDQWNEQKEEIQRLFREQWIERNGESSNPPTIPDPWHTVDFSNTDFREHFYADGMLFRSSVVKFSGSKFTKHADLCGAVFQGKVQAHQINFNSDFFARETYFGMGANFYGTRFVKPAEFDGATFEAPTEFREVRFHLGARFISSHFNSSACFNQSTFGAVADFRSAIFVQTASFTFATFTQDAAFHLATFQQGVSFASATFSGFSYFTKTRFGDVGAAPGLPEFTDCHFEKPTSFRQALFRDGYPDFSGAVLHDKTSFTARQKPTQDEIDKDKTLKGLTYWPKTTTQDPVNARESCATIRHVLTQQGLPEEAHFFFRREMHFAGLPSAGRSCAERLPYLLFGWLSDYGYSIKRPLLWLAAVWFVGIAAFWMVFCYPGVAPVLAKSDLGTAAALSFSNLFPLFGFGRVFLYEVLKALPRWAQVLSGLQTVASLPLLFFLGLALRQRFRLR